MGVELYCWGGGGGGVGCPGSVEGDRDLNGNTDF